MPIGSVSPGMSLPFWAVLPFVGFLLTIAIFPLIAPKVWSDHFGKISFLFGAPVALWFLFGAPGELYNTVLEYVSFLVLLGSLFTISGGIFLEGSLRGTPSMNCAFLGIGAIAANVFGTTGASMLLIRPMLRANAHRKKVAHVVIFFIFVVSNIGGLLTPVGDPPLFLGFLRGVPFLWTVRNLWQIWLFATGSTIGIFYVLDRKMYASEASGGVGHNLQHAEKTFLSIHGKENFLYLGMAISAVFLPSPWREITMVAAGVISVRRTPEHIRRENGFTYHPIGEVAILFATIFATMMPALIILKARGGDLGISSPSQFFWTAGSLSSFLDNAPTYLTFLSVAQGVCGENADIVGVSTPILRAISAGAVMMGANSYIGNAPNFMVKSIAEGEGVRMPSFFGYMGYSVFILLPVFILVTWFFL